MTQAPILALEMLSLSPKFELTYDVAGELYVQGGWLECESQACFIRRVIHYVDTTTYMRSNH